MIMGELNKMYGMEEPDSKEDEELKKDKYK